MNLVGISMEISDSFYIPIKLDRAIKSIVYITKYAIE